MQGKVKRNDWIYDFASFEHNNTALLLLLLLLVPIKKKMTIFETFSSFLYARMLQWPLLLFAPVNFSSSLPKRP